MNISSYIDSVDGFSSKSNTDKLIYMGYFFMAVNNTKTFSIEDVEGCFEDEHLKLPNHIQQLLHSKSTGKTPVLIKKSKGVYALSRDTNKKFDSMFGIENISVILSTNLFPIELFNNTRGYLESVAKQAIVCYDYGLYDASLVMIRKLLETLIIEAFEKFNKSSEIQNNEGNFYMLSDLIGKFLNHSDWNVGRNTKLALPNIKKIADVSAHNRRFVAKKSDIDNIKSELRFTIEELIHLIDY